MTTMARRNGSSPPRRAQGASFTSVMSNLLNSLNSEVVHDGGGSVDPSSRSRSEGRLSASSDRKAQFSRSVTLPESRSSSARSNKFSRSVSLAVSPYNIDEEEDDDRGGPDENSSELTEEEEHDNKVWQMRFMHEGVFARGYDPTWWERREMESITQFLALKDPANHPEFLDGDERQVTREAVSSIFFPGPKERRSVLLKRGPVIVDGEERELLLFTRGLVLCRVETDSLVDLMLEGGAAPGGEVGQQFSSEELQKRFQLIDADESGSLDRSEIRDFFRSMGLTLSETALDKLMKKMDYDGDGMISFEELESVAQELRNQANGLKNLRSSWRGFARVFSGRGREWGKDGRARRLDAAYQMSDLETVDVTTGNKDLTTLAMYLKGVDDPQLLTCAKEGHVKAWEEALRKCLQMQTEECGDASPDEEHDSPIDWGF